MREFSKPIFLRFILFFSGTAIGSVIYNQITQKPQDISRIGIVSLISALVTLYLARRFKR